MGQRLIDITGQKFGRLTAVSYDHETAKWSCVCECGNMSLSASHSLRHGSSRSCGCLANELTAQRSRGPRLMRRGPKSDLTGRIFGRLTVKSHDASRRRTHWLCVCACGTERSVDGTALRRGNTTSCGCWNREALVAANRARKGKPVSRRATDLTGVRFGRWTVSGDSDKSQHWECLCDCGKSKVVARQSLLTGASTSCGCRNSEVTSQRNRTPHPDMCLPKRDLTGQRFGSLVALRYESRPGNRSVWHCQCDCGGTHATSAGHLSRGAVRSCGCLRIRGTTRPAPKRTQRARYAPPAPLHPRSRDLNGQVFDRLTVVHHVGKAYWYCTCACGKTTVSHAGNLRAGGARSCGCLQREAASQRNRRPKPRSAYKRSVVVGSGLRVDSLLWTLICQAWGNACAYCAASATTFTQDHVHPISKGGEHSTGNLVPACARCNGRKGNTELSAALRKLGTKNFHQRRLTAIVRLQEMLHA